MFLILRGKYGADSFNIFCSCQLRSSPRDADGKLGRAPGSRNSSREIRSDTLFSMGVPVSKTLPLEESEDMDFALFVFRFFKCWASSPMTQRKWIDINSSKSRVKVPYEVRIKSNRSSSEAS